MGTTQAKELRGELARVIGELEEEIRARIRAEEGEARAAARAELLEGMNRELRETVSRQGGMISELKDALEKAGARMADVEARLARHENAHSPPSARSIAYAEEKAAKKEREEEGRKRGRLGAKDGHEGSSHRRRADRRIDVDPPAGCGGASARRGADRRKRVIEIPRVRAENIDVVSADAVCADCGHVTTPRLGIAGTSAGPGPLSEMVMLWKGRCTVQGIADIVRQKYGLSLSAGAVDSALAAASSVMEAEASAIAESQKGAPYLMIDGPGQSTGGHAGQDWLSRAGGPEPSAHVEAAYSRARAVLLELSPTDRPTVADGYSVYDILEERQRCMVHLGREAKWLARHPPDRGRAGLTRSLYGALMDLYRDAKAAAESPDPASAIPELESRARAIAAAYSGAGMKFGGTLEAAIPNMFTFLRHPGMPPHNNDVERLVREIKVHSKVRGQLKTPAGMKRFGVFMTCMMTWDLRKLNPMDRLRDLLGRQYPACLT